MTTTAEKIYHLRKRIDNLSDWLADLGEQIDKLEAEQNIEPADQEPLECWVNVYEDEIESFLKKGAAELGAVCGQPVRTTIRMREVTPQDEQDRKDAARYRFLKDNKTMVFNSTKKWDEMIDKEIEVENE